MPFDELLDRTTRIQIVVNDRVHAIHARLVSDSVRVESTKRAKRFLGSWNASGNAITAQDAYWGISAFINDNQPQMAARIFIRLASYPVVRNALTPFLPFLVRELIDREDCDLLNEMFRSAHNQPDLQRVMRVSAVDHLMRNNPPFIKDLAALANLDHDFVPIESLKIPVFKEYASRSVIDIEYDIFIALWKKSASSTDRRIILKNALISYFNGCISGADDCNINTLCSTIRKEPELAEAIGADLARKALRVLMHAGNPIRIHNLFCAFRCLPDFISCLKYDEISQIGSSFTSISDFDCSGELEKFLQQVGEDSTNRAVALEGMRRGFTDLASDPHQQGTVLKYLQANKENPKILGTLLDGVSFGFDRMNGYISNAYTPTSPALSTYKDGKVDPDIMCRYLEHAAMGTARGRHFKRQEALHVLRDIAAHIPNGLKSVRAGIIRAREDWAIKVAPEPPQEDAPTSQGPSQQKEARPPVVLKLIK